MVNMEFYTDTVNQYGKSTRVYIGLDDDKIVLRNGKPKRNCKGFVFSFRSSSDCNKIWKELYTRLGLSNMRGDVLSGDFDE